VKDEPISTVRHPWIPTQATTFTPVAGGHSNNNPGGGLPAGNNPLGRSAMTLEPNTLINWKESD
jgi:hypothetical protein